MAAGGGSRFFFLLNGKPIPRDQSFRSLVHAGDYQLLESTRDRGIEAKFGARPGEEAINIITKDHQNDPEARLFPPASTPPVKGR